MMEQLKKETLLKFLLIGDSGAGKTSLLVRYIDDTYLEQRIASIGIDFKIKKVELNDMNFKLQIWDTAGQERFRTITTAYYKAAAGILLTCDMSSDGCLENAERWYNEIKKNAPDAAIILIGTKNDLEAKIPVDVMRVWANERDIPFVSSSAKTGKGVTEAFMRLLKEVIILSKVDFGAIKAQIQNNQVLIQNNDDIKKKACC